jgi:chromosome segregation ATPase
MLFPIIGLIGMSACAFGQAAQTDNQTLQALLTEVRALRQDLRASLNRSQSMQVLLARFQIQEGVITRATEQLNNARQKLLDTQFRQKEIGLEQKRIEDSLPAPDPQQQSDLLDRLNHVKSDLEVTGHMAQQQQTAEIRVEQQLREEQDKLNELETQLDELVGSMGDSGSRPRANRP